MKSYAGSLSENRKNYFLLLALASSIHATNALLSQSVTVTKQIFQVQVK